MKKCSKIYDTKFISHKVTRYVMYMLIQINRSQHAFQFLGTFKLILIQSSLHHPYMLPSSCTLTSPSLLSYHYYYLHLITITIITISLIITISIITITIIITPTFIVLRQSSHYHNCLYNYHITPTIIAIISSPSQITVSRRRRHHGHDMSA